MFAIHFIESIIFELSSVLLICVVMCKTFVILQNYMNMNVPYL